MNLPRGLAVNMAGDGVLISGRYMHRCNTCIALRIYRRSLNVAAASFFIDYANARILNYVGGSLFATTYAGFSRPGHIMSDGAGGYYVGEITGSYIRQVTPD